MNVISKAYNFNYNINILFCQSFSTKGTPVTISISISFFHTPKARIRSVAVFLPKSGDVFCFYLELIAFYAVLCYNKHDF